MSVHVVVVVVVVFVSPIDGVVYLLSSLIVALLVIGDGGGELRISISDAWISCVMLMSALSLSPKAIPAP